MRLIIRLAMLAKMVLQEKRKEGADLRIGILDNISPKVLIGRVEIIIAQKDTTRNT